MSQGESYSVKRQNFSSGGSSGVMHGTIVILHFCFQDSAVYDLLEISVLH